MCQLDLIMAPLAWATGMRLASQTTSPWAASAGTPSDSPFIGPVGEALAVALIVGGLVSAFPEDGSRRLWAAVICLAGLLIAAANYLVWLAG
jgi:hypothetical protein